MNNFSKKIAVQAPDDNVYHALTNSISKWWTEMFEGVSNEQGQSFTIRFGPNIFKKMKVDELSTNKKIVWLVTDSLIDIPDLKNQTEWINTKIVWEIFSKESQTELTLTHFGLTPQIECYNICEMGWHNFTDSLVEFINTGNGSPFKLL